MSNVPPPPGYYAAVPPQPMSPSDEKMWSTLVHVGGILFQFLPALIGFLVLKDRGPFVRMHTATALNFQLTLVIAYFVGALLSIVLIGIFIMLAAWVLNIVFSIIAAIRANSGQPYEYPLTIRFIR